MGTFNKILLIIGILVIAIVGFLAYLDFFSTIKVEEKEIGEYTIAGIEIVGPYSKVGQYIGDVDKKLKELGINSSKGFGIYYDDPKITPKEKCRSFVGNIIDKKDFDKIKFIPSIGLKIDSIPKINAITAEFPIKNNMSYMIGPMKVYPVISKYMMDKKYKSSSSIEIYDRVEKKITFIMQDNSLK
jgi:hypothetical protein